MTTTAVPSEDLDAIREQVERLLEDEFNRQPQTEVLRAARYLTLGGGHRWRSLLAVTAGRVFHPHAERVVLPLAGALETLHAASLALDDLPSMDNAQTRRGKPCMHVVFPNWVSDMVPAFLVNMAYRVHANNASATEERRVRSIQLLGEMGANLAWGQELDLAISHAEVSEAALLECYALKSGSLFAAALAGAGILCGAGPSDIATLRECGLTLGQAYQFLDDLTDGSNAMSPDGSTCEDAGRRTAVALFGVSGTKARADELLAGVLRSLDRFGSRANPLRGLIESICVQPRSGNWFPAKARDGVVSASPL